MEWAYALRTNRFNQLQENGWHLKMSSVQLTAYNIRISTMKNRKWFELQLVAFERAISAVNAIANANGFSQNEFFTTTRARTHECNNKNAQISCWRQWIARMKRISTKFTFIQYEILGKMFTFDCVAFLISYAIFALIRTIFILLGTHFLTDSQSTRHRSHNATYFLFLREGTEYCRMSLSTEWIHFHCW